MLSETTLVPASEKRLAAKLLLRTDQNEIVFVAGKRGMLNLPGGGIDMGESSTDALYREIREELGLESNDIGALEEVGGTWADITTADGEAKRAVWHVYEAGLLKSQHDIVANSEITAVQTLSTSECLDHENMSILAKQAVLLSMGRRN